MEKTKLEVYELSKVADHVGDTLFLLSNNATAEISKKIHHAVLEVESLRARIRNLESQLSTRGGI